MLTQEQIDKIIEETQAKMREIDAEFEKTRRFIEEHQSSFAMTSAIKAEAEALMADARRKAEAAGRERAFAQEGVAGNVAPRARRSRGLAI